MNSKKKQKHVIEEIQPGEKNKKWHWLLGILLITIISYSPALKNGFNNWDDDAYLISNPNIELTKQNIETSFLKGEYHRMYLPLTSLSHSIIYHFVGLNPWYHHFANILLHLINIVLVYILIYLISNDLKITIITTILFGIHTLQVESVAYVSGRRDLLYALFFLASLISYIKYIKTLKRKYYFYSILIFILSLFSKGQAVSLAVTILVVDYFYDRNLFDKKVIIEKVPFFILSLILGIIAIVVQKSGRDTTPEFYSFYERILFACYGFIQYIIKIIIPYKLSAIHPYPSAGKLSFEYFISPILAMVIFFVTIYFIKRLKQIAFGLLFFIVNIFLVLQIIRNSYSITNEHYVYIPCIGLFFLVGVGYEWISRYKSQMKPIIKSFIIGYVFFLSVFTYVRCAVWKDSITLWNDVLSKYSNETTALNNRGIAKYAISNIAGAINDFNASIRLNPNSPQEYCNRGIAKYSLGDVSGAIADFNMSIKIKPYYKTYLFLGNIYQQSGNLKMAIDNYSKAIEIDSNFSNADSIRNLIKLDLQNYQKALSDSVFNNTVLIYYKHGVEKYNNRNYQSAIKDFDKVIELIPNSPKGYYYRGISKGNLKDYKGAIDDFNKTIELNSDFADAYFSRGNTKFILHNDSGACNDWNIALKLGYDATKIIQKHCN